MPKAFPLILISILAFSACHDDHVDLGSEYILISRTNKATGVSIANATISLFNSATNTLEEDIIDFDGGITSQICSATYSGGNLFLCFSSVPIVITKVSIESRAQISTVTTDSFSSLVPYGDKLLACSIENLPNSSSEGILVIDVYDDNLALESRFTGDNIHIYSFPDVEIIGEKLFCSVITSDTGPSIHVFDLLNKKQIKDFSLDDICYQFVPLDQGQVLAMESETFHFIDTQTLDIRSEKNKKPIGQFDVTYNTSDKHLYLISNTRQQAAYQFQMQRYNLITDEIETIVHDKPLMGPIIYDQSRNVLITGELRVFSTSGEQLYQLDNSPRTDFIFIK